MNWAVKTLNTQDDEDFAEHNQIVDAHKKALEGAENQIENLKHMRLLDQIDDEEYNKERLRLKNEITVLKTKESQVDMNRESWVELTKKAFIFACNAEKAFVGGSTEVKKDILSGIGVNWTILDEKLSFLEEDWIIPFKKVYTFENPEKTCCEPAKIGSFSREKTAFAALNPLMRPLNVMN